MALKNCKECGAQISKKASKCTGCGAPQRKTSLLTWVATAGVVFFLFNYLSDGGAQNLRERISENSKRSADKLEALANTSLDFDWKAGGFGSVMIADLTVKNNSKHNIKDIEIECQLSGKSGTKLSRKKKIIYDSVMAGKTRQFSKFNMGIINSQSSSAGCVISDLSII